MVRDDFIVGVAVCACHSHSVLRHDGSRNILERLASIIL